LALPPATPGTTSGKDAAASKAAQRDAQAQDVFLREVDDALRQDEVQGFFRNFGKPVLALVVAGLLGFAGYLYWDHHTAKQADERSEQLTQALDSIEASNLAEAKGKLDPLSKESGAAAVLAKLSLAGIALREGRVPDAVKLYGEVAADSAAPQELRDLATVREVAAAYDTMKPQAVIDRLKPLAVPGNAWFGVAGEMVGMAYLQQGKKDLAGPLFVQIAKDKDLPGSLQSRAQQLAGLIGYDALADVVDDKGEAVGAGVKVSASPATVTKQ